MCVCVSFLWLHSTPFASYSFSFALFETSDGVGGCFFFFCFRLSAVSFVIGCQLTCRLSRGISFHCDDAYSYEDNFIYLYSHYDLSMRWHNKGFNEFNSLLLRLWLLIIVCCAALHGISTDHSLAHLHISKTASDCIYVLRWIFRLLQKRLVFIMCLHK